MPFPFACLSVARRQVGSSFCASAPFERFLAGTFLISAGIYGSVISAAPGFEYWGLSPHRITPMPGVPGKSGGRKKDNMGMSMILCFSTAVSR